MEGRVTPPLMFDKHFGKMVLTVPRLTDLAANATAQRTRNQDIMKLEIPRGCQRAIKRQWEKAFG